MLPKVNIYNKTQLILSTCISYKSFKYSYITDLRTENRKVNKMRQSLECASLPVAQFISFYLPKVKGWNYVAMKVHAGTVQVFHPPLMQLVWHVVSYNIFVLGRKVEIRKELLVLIPSNRSPKMLMPLTFMIKDMLRIIHVFMEEAIKCKGELIYLHLQIIVKVSLY